jgi:Tfp pilus assembly protein PilF
MNTKHITLLAIAAMTAIPTLGCSSTSTRKPADGLSEIEPAIAYAQRRRQEAIEHYNTASQLHLDGKNDEALSEYRKALELDDQLYAAWNNMGQLLMNEGNNSDAVAAFQIASSIEQTDPRPVYNIGLVYQKVGWAKDSYTYFQSSLERDPNYLPAIHGLIRSAEMLGLGDERILEHIRNAQLRETDQEWREYLSTQFYRVSALLD